MSELAPNHHAHYPQFTGIFGQLASLTMIAGRGADARLVTEMAEVGPDDHVVDIGCGPGTAARAAASTGAAVTGVDPSGPMLRTARIITRIRPPRGAVRWVKAGAEKMALPDHVATVAWSLASVHHWPQLDEGLDEVGRILKPGGRLIVLEKRTEPGATGNASHGWTPAQAKDFATMLEARGYEQVKVNDYDLGKRQVVTVSARR